MARVIESDLLNNRVFSMWTEAGLQFRSNLILKVGGSVPLHAHSYDHVAICLNGRFKCEIDNDYFNVTPGTKVFIAQGRKHTFTLLERINDLPGEVLCIWPCLKE